LLFLAVLERAVKVRDATYFGFGLVRLGQSSFK
jgi:hypothetical protein